MKERYVSICFALQCCFGNQALSKLLPPLIVLQRIQQVHRVHASSWWSLGYWGGGTARGGALLALGLVGALGGGSVFSFPLLLLVGGG